LPGDGEVWFKEVSKIKQKTDILELPTTGDM